MKRVSNGVDSISVWPSLLAASSSFVLPRSPQRLIYLLLLLCSSCTAAPSPSPSSTAAALESALLSKLGLTPPPSSTTAGPLLPVPQHFLDLYKKVDEGMLDETSIRLVYPQELVELNAGLLLSYNLSLEAQQARREKVISAQLKLRVTPGGAGSVKIYRVDDLSKLRVERLLDSVEILARDQEQIIDFDVTEGVPYRNQRHLVRFLVVFPSSASLAESPTHSLSALPLSRAASAAMVVRYLESEGEEDLHEENEHPKRRKRSASEEERRKTERKERRRKNRKHRTGGEKGICHRKSMYVDFDELKWNDWILAPAGYDAFQCSGGCPFPFPSKVNASNHAIIQGLLHNYNSEVPEPCCVPTQMEPLTILFRDVKGRIAIKAYPDMIVQACGCR